MAPSFSRARVIGCPVDVVDMDAAVEAISAMVEARRSGRSERGGVVVTLNPEMAVHAQRNASFQGILERAELVIPDGIGIVRALRRRGFPDAVRVTGADLLDACCARAATAGYRVALAGAGAGVAEAAAARYRELYPGLEIVLADGGDPTLVTVEKLTHARPDIVAAAYGHGRQERFLDDHLATIGAGCGIGIGGSLDYVAGVVKRAPSLVRGANLEWAWRLALQPWRVQRQLVLPRFWMMERREAWGVSR